MYKYLEDQNAVNSRLRFRDMESYKLVTRGVSDLNNDHWGKFSEDCRDLIRALMAADPSKRPNAFHVRDHLWFKTPEERVKALIRRE
jgi:serine/threonine protein kinase